MRALAFAVVESRDPSTIKWSDVTSIADSMFTTYNKVFLRMAVATVVAEKVEAEKS